MRSHKLTVSRWLALTFATATILATTLADFAQAQPYGYDYSANLYNTPAETHHWYDRGNTDFNS